MTFVRSNYRVLKQQIFTQGEFSIAPIRYEDRFEIMKWRNEQLYHLRQTKPLTKLDQEKYFSNVVSALFDEEYPKQILFSYLKDDKCFGYGGLVHINWKDKNAEISFVMNSDEEKKHFEFHWSTFLQMLENVAFYHLAMHKIYTYAFDIRPHLYKALESVGFEREVSLKEHCFIDKEFRNVVIHSKINRCQLRPVDNRDMTLFFDWANDSEVRKNAFNSQAILWQDHIKWFNDKLNSKNSKIFVLMYENTPIGQIRFDKNESQQWIIDYSISNGHRGKGFGSKILAMGLHEFRKGTFIGLVKKNNHASVNIFRKMGFETSFTDNEIVQCILISK